MKTTLRARLLRLCSIGVTGTGIILTAAAAIGAYNMAYSSNIRLGESITNNCSGSISDELVFLTEHISEAGVSEDGDSIFERISLLSDNVYDTSGSTETLSKLSDGELVILPAAEQDGEPINLAAFKTDGDILIGELTYDYLGDYLNGIDENDMAIVTDSSGNVISTTEEYYQNAGVNIAELGLEDILSSLQNGENGTSAVKLSVYDGERALVTYSTMGETDYYIIYAAEYDELFASYHELLDFLIIFQLICIAASVIVAINVSKAILTPVTNTTDRLVKLSMGDLSTPCISTNRGDETQVLSEALQKTISVISDYIRDIDSVLSAISEGDLNAKSSVEYEGDFVGIKTSLDGIASHLKETMTAINSVGGKVLTDSDTLSSGAQLLAGNTANEAAAIERITSMTDGIESGAEKNTETTGRASRLLVTVMDDIETGGRTVGEMIDSMTEIKPLRTRYRTSSQ